MNRILFLLSGLAVLAGCASAPATGPVPLADDGTPCIADRDAYMDLDYWTFDQDAERGVRAVLDKPGCELAGADLIADFHAALREKGEPVTYRLADKDVTFSDNGEVGILYWHEAQVRAFAGQTDRAIALFHKSIEADKSQPASKRHYALATIAFLEDNRQALLDERKALAAIVPDDDLNLGVVDGLIACFGRSYTAAYGAPECDRRPANRPALPG